MDVMINYSVALLGAIADFLATEPIIYLFGIICLAAVVKIFKALMP